MSYIFSEEAVCPNSAYHRGDEDSLTVVANNEYMCGCGCIFEWYDSQYWFIIKDGHKDGPQDKIPIISNYYQVDYSSDRLYTIGLILVIFAGLAAFASIFSVIIKLIMVINNAS